MRALALALVLLLAGCAGQAPPPVPDPGTDDPAPTNATAAQPWEDVDAGRLDSWTRLQLRDGDRVLYRIPGTEDHQLVADRLQHELDQLGLRSWSSRFPSDAPLTGEVEGRNLWGVGPDQGPWLVLAAHWDSRALADKDPDPDRRDEPVPGANDGAAAVAVVLEAARVLTTHDALEHHTLAVALFDVEDQGRRGCHEWAQGSRHEAGLHAGNVSALLLVDMPAAEDLRIPREGHSHAEAGWLVDILMTEAERLEAPSFDDEPSHRICDDHVPWLQQSVPSADLLHLDEGPDPFPDSHHTTFDDLDHIDLDRMEEVTRVLIATAIAADATAADGVIGP